MKSYNRQTKGFSLFEVLVALIILTIGMLGIADLLMIAHKSNSSNYIRQQAIQSAYDIIDHMRANRQAAINGNYTISNLTSSGAPSAPSTPSTICDQTACSASEIAAYDTWYWLSTEVTRLPNGCGAISITPSGINNLITVTVQWDDRPAKNMLGDTSQTPTQLIVQSEL